MQLNKSQRALLRQKYHGHCSYCGSLLTDKWHADHLEPVCRESTYIRGQGHVATGRLLKPQNDKLENLMPSCVPCNIDKSDSSLEQWRVRLQRSTQVLTKNYSTYRHALRFRRITEATEPVVFYFEQYHPIRQVNGQ